MRFIVNFNEVIKEFHHPIKDSVKLRDFIWKEYGLMQGEVTIEDEIVQEAKGEKTLSEFTDDTTVLVKVRTARRRL
jgi:hypothetical protein